ncbi:N-acetyl-1-D-myo-inositol-2-amino-2-deoxy-alpha-D-glucopyranoside deacetylase [Corynebacterium crudilactis]|uniref:1D-myo-inositol 2-acetamido-2-deoxy-alpha-D-glucopyranoside deacetylase n=1 Tax=Corynebacterium crudilactis TaxID=1652495 RepID=A0A172QSN1_9CORY|nr:N-acetyl-1-D-myo-inositol-2-amino-2-deoxy-alpha-D-glucopyranoside deacetylase [Corynebacterium crudilactis]ANE03684.1 N-acetyl-1-D-myo-inositol-2-amino-2-deoxy-alpha-D-glucopyranoside deacetylase [Corynebacterium crudilactis]
MLQNNNELSGARVVAVHAHPDDEAITTGGVLADLAARGADVTVITCTLGEQGEVIGDTFAQLVNGDADQLGGFRIHELYASLEILGARGIHLGGAGCWRDSGMVGDPANEHPRAFIHSADRAVEQLTALLQELRPHVLLTYGPDGGYGHPDHIRAHEITHAAAAEVGVERILWAVSDREELEEGQRSITQLPRGWSHGELAAVDAVDLAVELSDEAYATKVESMRAHATQLWIADGSVSRTNPAAAYAVTIQADVKVWALSNLIAQPIMRREHYQLGFGAPLPADASGVLDGVEF